MYPVSGRWDDAIRSSPNLQVVVEVWRSGARQTLPDGTTSLAVVDGTLMVDESQKVRRSLNLTTANPELTPVLATDLLSPATTDLKVFIGPQYTEGDVELAPMGVFRISSSARSGYLAGVSITAGDYTKVLTDARFLAPWATPAGNLVSAEIQSMALDALPGLTFIDLTGSTARTTATSWDRNRWDAMDKLASSIGAEVFFDVVGRLILRPVPQVTSSSTSVWSVNAGDETAVITDYATALSADRVYNAVVATSSAQGVTASGAAYLTDGPYAYSATFKRPQFYSSPMLTTVGQCQSAASAILARSSAASRQISAQVAPNPALDVGDIVQVTLMPEASGRTTSELRVVSKLTFPLRESAMSLDTRVGLTAATTSDVGSLQ